MLSSNDLKEYFEKFFVNYAPFRDSKVYSTIIDKLFNNYFNDAYNNIPTTFKDAYEEQKIPIEFYNNILLSVGFNNDILNKLSYKDKEILLKTFTNFNIYKGTLNQIQKVASDFEEELNLYELFIDFRTILIPYYHLTFFKNLDYVVAENEFIYDSIKVNDYLKIPGDNNSYRVVTKKELNKIYIDKPFDFDVIIDLYETENDSLRINNVNVDRWVFVPDLIYSGEKVKNQIINRFLDYDAIYNETRKYFISIEYLEANRDSLILPIKSNLILIDYKKYRNINLLNYLFAAILLKEYRKTRMVIYFKDGKYLTNLERIYKLWYYVIFSYYNKGISTNGLPNPALIFSIDSPYFDLKITDIEKLIIEYNNIQTQYESSLFYDKYFKTKLFPLQNNTTEIPLEQFKLLIENEIGLDLFEYVTKRIENAKGIDSEFECDFILDELQSSILTWAYTNDIKHIDYLTDSLSYISTSVDLSPTYNLILFLKPFHVELVKESGEILEINNKFNLMNSFHKYKFFISLYKASILNISHRLMNSELTLIPKDSLVINSKLKSNIFYSSKSILSMIDSFFQSISYFEESTEFQNHKDLFKLKLILNSFVSLVNENIIIILKQNYDNNVIQDKIKLLVGGEFESLIILSNEVVKSLKSTLLSNTIIVDEQLFSDIIYSIYNDVLTEHNVILNDSEIRLIKKSIVNTLHDIIININIQDFDTSGRNILDVVDTEIVVSDFDTSGRNFIDISNVDIINRQLITYKFVNIVDLNCIFVNSIILLTLHNANCNFAFKNSIEYQIFHNVEFDIIEPELPNLKLDIITTDITPFDESAIILTTKPYFYPIYDQFGITEFNIIAASIREKLKVIDGEDFRSNFDIVSGTINSSKIYYNDSDNKVVSTFDIVSGTLNKFKIYYSDSDNKVISTFDIVSGTLNSK